MYLLVVLPLISQSSLFHLVYIESHKTYAYVWSLGVIMSKHHGSVNGNNAFFHNVESNGISVLSQSHTIYDNFEDDETFHKYILNLKTEKKLKITNIYIFTQLHL